MKARYDLSQRPRVAYFLEHSNRRNSRGTCANAFRCILCVHTPDRDHRNAHAAADLRQPLNPQWGAEATLRGRVVDRPKKNVIGSSAFRFVRLIQAMAGDANSEISRSAPAAAPTNYLARRRRFAAEMNARCAGSDGDVEAVVYQDGRLAGEPRIARGSSYDDRFARQCRQVPCRQILFANLHPVRACLNGRANSFEQTWNRRARSERS